MLKRCPEKAKSLICRVSSAVEQRFCKPLVGSSILSPGTIPQCSPCPRRSWPSGRFSAQRAHRIVCQKNRRPAFAAGLPDPDGVLLLFLLTRGAKCAPRRPGTTLARLARERRTQKNARKSVHTTRRPTSSRVAQTPGRRQFRRLHADDLLLFATLPGLAMWATWPRCVFVALKCFASFIGPTLPRAT